MNRIDNRWTTRQVGILIYLIVKIMNRTDLCRGQDTLVEQTNLYPYLFSASKYETNKLTLMGCICDDCVHQVIRSLGKVEESEAVLIKSSSMTDKYLSTQIFVLICL